MLATHESSHSRTRRGVAGRFGALICACVAALAPFSAEAVGTLDSDCEPGFNGFAIVSYGGEWAQTFSAGKSGKLLTVDVRGLGRQPDGTGDINIKLYGVDESGAPVAPALDSTTIPTASIPTNSLLSSKLQASGRAP